MSRMLECLKRATKSLGLEIDEDFELALNDTPHLKVPARIPQLGSKMGMLVFDQNTDLSPLTAQLIAAGFGYAVLDQPRDGEPFDLQSYQDMFIDWGWCGPIDQKPSWL